MDRSEAPPSRTLRVVRIGAAVVLAGVLLYGIAGSYRNLHERARFVDEDYWISATYYYTLLARRDFDHPDWSSPLSYDQPPLGKYIFGAALDLNGRPVPEVPVRLAAWFDFVLEHWLRIREPTSERDRELEAYRVELARSLPPLFFPGRFADADVWLLRKVALAFAVLAIAACLALAVRAFGSALVGLVAMVHLWRMPAVEAFELALVDSICLLWIVLVVAVAWRLVTELDAAQPSRRRVIAFAALCGALLALALSTKLITTYLIVFVGSVLAARSLLRWPVTGRRGLAVHAGVFAIVLVVCGVLVIALNPYFYSDLISHLGTMMDHRLATMELQARAQPGAVSGGDKLALIVYWGIAQEPAARLTPMAGLSLGLFATGLVSLVKHARDELARKLVGPHALLGLWLLCTFVINGWGLRMGWARYFLPFTICSAFVIGLGAVRVLEVVTARMERLRAR